MEINLKTIQNDKVEDATEMFSDERFKYELMWTGFSHVPASEQVKELKERGLLFDDGTTPTIRKATIGLNKQNGTGVLWYIQEKNWRTLGMMEKELGLSSQGMMEFYKFGRPAKPLNEAYACVYCDFVAGSQVILDLHLTHQHANAAVASPDDAPAPEGLGEAPAPHGPLKVRCSATKADGTQCGRYAAEGSIFCSHPAHRNLSPDGTTTSATAGL
jgi:hypothetical protein